MESTWPHIHSPPRLLASTDNAFCGSIAATSVNPALHTSSESNLFNNLQWTQDGSTVLAQSEDCGLRTFILPPDLLSPRQPHHRLTPYAATFTPSRAYASAIYPQAALSSPESMVYICAVRGGPVRLHSLLHANHLLGSYPLVNPHTEAYEAPHALLIPPAAPHTFLAGTTSKIALFDLHRYGQPPVVVLKTTPARRAPATTTTMKGIVTAFALGGAEGSGGGSGVLAAGTNTRQVGLYDSGGLGQCIGVFTLEPDSGGGDAGGGVTQLAWSACERYLYIAERRSSVVSVYDIRVTKLRVQSFQGRPAQTNQRLGVDVARALGGQLVGGGVDGVVRVWQGHGHGEAGAGAGECVGKWQAHDDVVGSAVVHPAGAVMATCSGSRKTFGRNVGSRSSSSNSSSSSSSSDGGSTWDNSLKVWEIPVAPRVVDL